MLLQTSDAVAAFVESLSDAPYVTVDTEFLTEKRFRPQLCLVQLGAPGLAAAVDPMVPGIDLSPVAALLADTDVLKVMHSGSQDVAIFLHLFGEVPKPLRDTQVMASVCGFGDQAGYSKLVEALVGVEIDKTAQATDWSLRPLTEQQVEYALGDVIHLCPLYEALVERLEALGRAGWVDEELASLTDPESYRVDPEGAWRKIRVRRPTPRTLAVIQRLAAWRESTADRRNKPRQWMVRDDALVEIAECLPADVDALARVRRLGNGMAKSRDGRTLLSIVAEVLATPEESWPEVEARRVLTPPQRAAMLLLQALLELRCGEHDVGTRLVASNAELEALVCGDTAEARALHGWRAEVFGTDAVALLAGGLSLTVGADGARVVAG
ncbi:MAG: ribonuclease D [Myxococcota bacterium]|jgi:ribonuclease D